MLLLLQLVLFAVGCQLWWNIIANNHTWQADLTNFYTGWRMVYAGDGAELYDMAAQTRTQHAILGADRRFADGLLPFVNPPYSVFFFIPLWFFDLSTVYTLWAIVNGLLLGIVGRWLWQETSHWQVSERWGLLACGLGFMPLFWSLSGGTFGILVLLSMLGCYRAVKAERPWQAAFWIVIASIKFQLILFLLIWLLASKRWPIIWRGLVIGVGLAIPTTLLLGWHVWGDYLAILNLHSHSYNQYGIIPSEGFSLRGTLASLFAAEQIDWLNRLSQLGLLISASWFSWVVWHQPATPQSLAWQYALAVLLSLLFALHMNSHDAVVSLIAGWLIYDLGRNNGQNRRLALGLGAIPTLLLFGDNLIGKTWGIQIPTIIFSLAVLYLSSKRQGLVTLN